MKTPSHPLPESPLIPSPIGNSLLDAGSLIPLLTSDYDLEHPLSCELIRRGFNDTYRVAAAETRWVYRVYFNHKYYIRSADDFRFELELLTFLAGEGIPVARPVRRRDGDLLSIVPTPLGERCSAVFTWAPGEPSRELTAEQARTLGRATAGLHLAADRFTTPYHRYHLNLEYLLDRPLQLIERLLQETGRGALDQYRPRLRSLREEIAALPTLSGIYGIIHGDLHSNNFHFGPAGKIQFFDFDHGGYGWRAYDLASCISGVSPEARDACLAGYQELRPLSREELAGIDPLRRARRFWDWGDVIAMAPAWGETEPDAERAGKIMEGIQRVMGD